MVVMLMLLLIITMIIVTIVNLSTKENEYVTKQLNDGFKRVVYCNEYKTKAETKNLDNDNLI